MRIAEKTPDRLILIDDQADKRLALTVLGGLLAGGSIWTAFGGELFLAALGLALVGGIYLYARHSRMVSRLTFDRAGDQVALRVSDRKGVRTWECPLSDVATARVDRRGPRGGDSGTARPELVLTDGTHVPMRPYHAAGGQSWTAVAAVKLFLGQVLDDAPVGWLPPDIFDTHFGEEMRRHYRKR